VRSIRATITLWVTAAAAVVLVVCAAAVFAAVRFWLVGQFDDTLAAKAEGIISSSEYEDGDVETDLDVEGFAGFGSDVALDFFEMARADGQRESASPSLGDSRLVSGDLPPQGSESFAPVRLPGDEPGRMMVRWFSPTDDNTGRPAAPYCLAVASRSDELERSVAVLGGGLALSTGIALVALVPIVRVGLARGLAPLERLAEEAAALDAEALDHRFDVGAIPVELRPVTGRLNDLLGRLDRSFERERRFSSDAAHELRAPVAELRAIAEVALAWADQATPEQFAEVLAITVEMQKLVDHLIQLAHAEGGASSAERVGFEFSTRVGEAVERLDDQAAERGVTIESDLAPGAWQSDPVIWSLIARNLIGNAVRYAPAGSVVRVRARPGALAVQNPATGLEPGDLEHFGERFWRKDGSRSGYGHSGLGLALVKAHAALICAAFKARIEPDTETLEVSVVENGAR
jgi:signal transduction histidine kinase